jgi:hypothetical protein
VYSYAPIIGNIPDVLIGDKEDNGTSCGLTDLNFFRFTDAFNFDEYVSCDPMDPDCGTTYPQIVRWSFLKTTTADLVKINGILSIADPSESIQPDLVGKELTAYPNTDPIPRASSLASFRDLVDSPEPDAPPYPDPTEATCLNTIITIYASNGSKTDSKEINVKANVLDTEICLPDGLSFPVACIPVKDYTSPATEGWVPRGVGWPADGLYFANTADGKPFYVATHSSLSGNARVAGSATRFVYGMWRDTGTDVLYVANNVYQIKYKIASDQPVNKVPNCRLLTYFKSPTASIMNGGNRVGKGLFPPDADGNEYNVYVGPPDLTAAGATYLEVNFEVIDFDNAEEGINTMDECHISRFPTPTKGEGTLVKTYTTWAGFASYGGAILGTGFVNATMGSNTSGLYIETAAAIPTGNKIIWGEWLLGASASSETFELGNLYRCVYTLNKTSGSNIGKIRMINGSMLGDWNAKITLIPDQVQTQMPQITPTEYDVWFESMPALYGNDNDKMSYMFDVTDGSAAQNGRLYLSKIELYTYPIPCP